MRVRRRSSGEELAMNMTPVVDVVFQLLIFFMVATTYVKREEEMDVDLPVAESGEEKTLEREEVVINLMRDGRIVVDGQDHTRESLTTMLARVAASDARTPVTIRGDKAAVLESLVSVMDACRVAGLSNLGVMTLDS